ncbi:hypothetical protein ABTZ03_39815 [Kitasatospora sp. NPDC096077]
MENRSWIRSNACSHASNCPEVAIAPDSVYVHSGLLPDAIRNGEFDA